MVSPGRGVVDCRGNWVEDTVSHTASLRGTPAKILLFWQNALKEHLLIEFRVAVSSRISATKLSFWPSITLYTVGRSQGYADATWSSHLMSLACLRPCLLLLKARDSCWMISVVLCRIESLVGQAEIQQVALGSQHSLFLDKKGIVYSCGDNKQVIVVAISFSL